MRVLAVLGPPSLGGSLAAKAEAGEMAEDRLLLLILKVVSADERGWALPKIEHRKLAPAA